MEREEKEGLEKNKWGDCDEGCGVTGRSRPHSVGRGALGPHGPSGFLAPWGLGGGGGREGWGEDSTPHAGPPGAGEGQVQPGNRVDTQGLREAGFIVTRGWGSPQFP